MQIYFTDFFNLNKSTVEEYGAFNISLISDLPLFIDPFLLFGSENEEYLKLHKDILKYISFLKEKSEGGSISKAQVKSWYLFPEVKQNWFGYSKLGNGGNGLGPKFGSSMSSMIHIVFDDLGREVITQSNHLEKATLFEIGVGRDHISDFTTNLIKNFLLEYTQKFALDFIDKSYIKKVKVEKVYFDYNLERWMPKEFSLPYAYGDYVLLTPRDILTKDETWINSNDLRGDFRRICNSIPNDQLRQEILNYFAKQLPKKDKNKENTNKEISEAVHKTIKEHPEIIKWYVKIKEENKQGAKNISQQKVNEVELLFVDQLGDFIKKLSLNSDFYKVQNIDSYKESLNRLHYLKDVIENKDGYRIFYVNGTPIKREEDLQIIYRLTWYASDYDVNREVNNGRGPVDYSISKGSKDKTLVEFKLASNSKLKQNLQNQVEIYQKANNTSSAIKVILFFNTDEYQNVTKILTELKIDGNENIILINAGKKVSASNATS